MAARADSTSSEKFLSNVTRENKCNFYDSDLGEVIEECWPVDLRQVVTKIV